MGVFCSASTVVCWRRFVGDAGVVVVVVAVFEVCHGNHPVGGAGGGLEELTVQDKCFSHLHGSAVLMMAFCTV